VYCAKCGNNMNEGQQFCDKCGTKVGTAGEGAQQPQQPVYQREKSDGLAAVLSFLWAGLGQIYVGRIGRGLAIMLLGILIVIIGFFTFFLLILVLVYWIWNVYDAYKLAQEYNDRLRSTGNRPW